MNVVRMVIVILYLVVFGLESLVLLPLGFLHAKFNPRAAELWQLHFVQRAFRIIYRILHIDVTYRGLEHLPQAGEPVLYVSNHRSMFDIILTYAVQPGPIGYISKKEWEKIPFLSWWMKRISCIFLDRDDIREGLKVVLAAIDKVKHGTSITVYPEGQRFSGSHELCMLPFREGSLKIASKPNVPIIPVAVHGTSKLWEEHVPLIKAGAATIWFGEPIQIDALSDEDKKHLGRYVHKIIYDMLVELNREDGYVPDIPENVG